MLYMKWSCKQEIGAYSRAAVAERYVSFKCFHKTELFLFFFFFLGGQFNFLDLKKSISFSVANLPKFSKTYS